MSYNVNTDYLREEISRQLGFTPLVRNALGDKTFLLLAAGLMFQCMREGRKIEAIKWWRLISNDGLKEAKDYIEALEDKTGIKKASPTSFVMTSAMYEGLMEHIKLLNNRCRTFEDSTKEALKGQLTLIDDLPF